MAEPQRPGSTDWLEHRTGIMATPAPQSRLSSDRVLHENRRPSAPEPAADVTFTSGGLLAGRHLIDVHDQYRSELAELRDVLEQVRSRTVDAGKGRAELQAMVARVNAWAVGGYCQRQCLSLTEHHGIEDASIFPHLRQRQPDLTPVLDALQDEHRVIHALLERVDAALIALAQQPDELTELADVIDLLTDTAHSHFAYEERELIAPLARFGFFPGQL
jgi:hypothetical protein